MTTSRISVLLFASWAMLFVGPAIGAEPAVTLSRSAPGSWHDVQRGQSAPPVVSPEVRSDRRIVFRLRAPEITAARVIGGDIPGIGRGEMSKDDDGVWSLTTDPVPAGAYRYVFEVGGVRGTDGRNPATSESNNTTWSLVVVPGSEAFDTRNVPHGAVAEVTYHSETLGRFRRLHVYTPPGYESGSSRLPVLYLLHGAGDSDDSWTTVGRAGIIVDNLIAAGSSAPMIVVMPAGHTQLDGQGSMSADGTDEFVAELMDDIVPLVEGRYRVLTDRAHRAIAGLSMGGHQSLNAAIAHPESFAYVGVFSSGLIRAFGDPEPDGAPPLSDVGREWETRHATALDDAEARAGLRRLWFATGDDDFLLNTTLGTVELLERHGFEPEFKRTAGGHTWLNWRDYLAEFVPMLFK